MASLKKAKPLILLKLIKFEFIDLSIFIILFLMPFSTTGFIIQIITQVLSI